MKVIQWVSLCLMVAFLAAAGCGGSSSGSSSASGGGASGDGSASSVFTAFITSGTVRALDDQGQPIAGAEGTVENSKLIMNLETVPRPFVVEVSDAVLANGKKMDSSLSRVVIDGDSRDEIYVTAFSTIKAQVFLDAMERGSSHEEALAIGQHAMEVVFNSLGLEMELKVDEIEDICPVGDDPKVAQLEYAQQALFILLGVEDNAGLTGFDRRLEQRVLRYVAMVGMQFSPMYLSLGAGKNVSEFIKSNENLIKARVNQTFSEVPKGVSTVSLEQVKEQEVEFSETKEPEIWFPNDPLKEEAAQPGTVFWVKLTVMSDTRDEAQYMKYEEAEFSASISSPNIEIAACTYTAAYTVTPTDPDTQAGPFGSSFDTNPVNQGFWIKVLDGAAAGNPVVTITAFEKDNPTNVFTNGTYQFEVVEDGDATVTAVRLENQSDEDYYLFSTPSEPGVGSRTISSVIPLTEKGKINAWDDDCQGYQPVEIKLKKSLGNPAANKSFDVILESPTGYDFSFGPGINGNSVSFSVLVMVNGNWAIVSDPADLFQLYCNPEIKNGTESSAEVSIGIGGNMEIIPTGTPQPMGPKAFQIKVKKGDEVVATSEMQRFFIRESKLNQITKLQSLMLDEVAGEIVDEEGFATGAVYKDIPLTGSFDAIYCTWHGLAKSWEDSISYETMDPDNVVMPDEAFLTIVGEGGGFIKNESDTPLAQIPVTLKVAKRTDADDEELSVVQIESTSLTDWKLRIPVGENEDNFKQVNLSLVYDDEPDNPTVIENNEGLKFVTSEQGAQ